MKHESMLITTGEAHCLVWLFFPFCAFLSKAGECFNSSIIFVADDMVETAITDAKTRHRLFLDAQARHGIEHSPEDKYIWLPSLAIGKADPSTEYEKHVHRREILGLMDPGKTMGLNQ